MATSNIEIAQQAELWPIGRIAAGLGIPDEELEPYGRYKAKVSLRHLRTLRDRPRGRLVLMTAVSPTPAGEGKTTTTVGLGDALTRIGERAMICLREPALGPVFGMKGGAAGGGYAQVVPMEDINLHFTGDFSAIGIATNLLAALIDNHVHHGNALGIDVRRVTWRRVLDVNDRALRDAVIGLGGPSNGYPREDGFDIVVASEVMAIFCLATDLADLKERLGEIVVAYTRDRTPVRARDLQAHGAMAAILRDALAPNLVQTLEHTPAFVHGGPFANIAHGCNSYLATDSALRMADYVVTEAGFGADLGAEKFVDILCRTTGLRPDVAVVVATVRAMKYHGGVEVADLPHENVAALERGTANLVRHLTTVRETWGIPAVVAINHRAEDTDAEIAALVAASEAVGVTAVVARHFAEGGAGAEASRARSCGCAPDRLGPDGSGPDGAQGPDAARDAGPDAAHGACRAGTPVHLPRRRDAVAQDERDRDAHLRRIGGDGVDRRARADQAPAGRGVRRLSGVRRQDAVLVLDRPEAARRADRPRRRHPRGAPRRGRAVRRDDLRRHHDDARPSGRTGRQHDRRRRGRPHRRALLTAASAPQLRICAELRSGIRVSVLISAPFLN